MSQYNNTGHKSSLYSLRTFWENTASISPSVKPWRSISCARSPIPEQSPISHKLPILITEKTGPHFAIGDTCFSHEEELHTYNPDGKEMKCKENSFSMLRHTDTSHAYFNCHTDITIPYNELGDIIVHKPCGTMVKIIENGKFVLPGTEELNKPLD